MSLVEDFSYKDPKGLDWISERGRTVDGASIPSMFWSSGLGTPFVGDYRRASVVHDVWCQDRTRKDLDTHRMFYYACRCDGVGKIKAFLMYAAIRLFGPKWKDDGSVYSAQIESYKYDEIELYIEENGHDMSLDDVDDIIASV